MNKLKRIKDVMLPMTILNWLTGCGGIIEYPLEKPHKKISLIYSSASALNFCLLTYLIAYYKRTILLKNHEEAFNSSNSHFKIIFYAQIFFATSTIIMGWKQRKGLKMSMQNIEKVDELLRKLGISNEYDKMYKRQIYILVFTVTILTIFITINWKIALFMCPSCPFMIRILIAMKNHYPSVIMFIHDFMFISYIGCLRRKFEQLNEVLKNMSGTSPLHPQYIKVIIAKTGMKKPESDDKPSQKTNDDVQIIKVAKQAHLDLVKICKNINGLFGLHLLMSMTLSSVFIIYLSYNVYTVYTYSHKESNYKEITPSSNYILLYIVKILAVNHICDRTSLEALKTGSIICELHEPGTSNQFRTEIREFTLQLIQNPLKFTAFGFVILDHTFIQDVVGTITTYLVILIQLRDIIESK